jgi:hypothetical protein
MFKILPNLNRGRGQKKDFFASQGMAHMSF